MKMTLLFTQILIFTLNVWAVADFKNFAVGKKEGTWEASMTILEGPQKGKTITQKYCVDGKKNKDAVKQAMEAAHQATNCQAKVNVDKKDEVETTQTCEFNAGGFVIKSTSTIKMKKIDDNTFEALVNSNTNGQVMSSKTVTKFVGPCTEQAKAETKKKESEACSKCQVSLKKAKGSCDKAKGPGKDACLSSVQQVETMCKISCNQ